MSIRYAARPPKPASSAPEPAPEIWSGSLVTFYETDPGLISSVLPKPLEMADEPLVRLNIATVDLPGMTEPLGAAVMSVSCRHEDRDGFYDLLMVMTSEAAVTGGREIFGEPKKIGTVSLERSDGRIHGVVGRRGVDFLEVEGTVTEAVEPLPPSERVTFYFKFLMDPQGNGFDHDPALVYCTRNERQRLRERVLSTVTLRDSPFDPIADLPVRTVVGSHYSESNSTQSGEIHGTVPQDWILPFAHQRYDHLAIQP